ncbi:late transcription factor VLTF-2 [Fowlpox virus]|nr:late transcription factor VLTF-2 [Fowlpox virus]
MYKKVNLSGIIISEPKSVKKNRIKESITNVVPKYYQVLADKKLKVRNNNGSCWFCKQDLNSFTYYFIKTLYGHDIGFFCSKICRDSFANMIKGVIALREEPKVSLLPLEVYENPEEIIEMINELREKDGTYGNCILESEHDIRLTLRCHCNNIK